MTDIDDRPAERTRARPVRDGMALGLAVGVSGIAFGAAAVGSGMSVAQACVLSLLAFTGASQFALAGAVATGGGLIGGAPSRIALAAPPIRPPPVATAPARANCDAPVKARRLKTQA